MPVVKRGMSGGVYARCRARGGAIHVSRGCPAPEFVFCPTKAPVLLRLLIICLNGVFSADCMQPMPNKHPPRHVPHNPHW